ncbi:DUF2808 domain-containing protein [Leptolyngbya sp. FACHB-711]|jgi:hypothetical protein|uniref:DUF2808 domain-containing protein n=1 Tax=unclassified Leptolyngbya TaxID=2650499 RepID=UPI0016896724|nr:DUF2808 domain-containing protein [Leptolyngbya sp. FACHB-711]MBD2025810.1 DUF2808 domain-containing protein [Leptolyngbya sp. FACHB-711]
MKHYPFLALSLTLAVFLGAASSLLSPFNSLTSAQAQDTQSPRAAFTRPPRLVSAENPEKQVAVRSSVYYFTLEVPPDSGSGLQQVSVVQRDGSSRIRRIRYDLEATRAFVGTANDRGTEIPIAQKTYDEDSQTVTLAFASPVPSGTTVTLALEAQRNPRMQGVYLFGVTAYPEGSTTSGQFLGYTRLTFYGNDGIQLLSD